MTVRREGPGVAKLVALLDGLEGVQGKTGWFESATYPTGQPVAYIATIQEFGYAGGGIPARPFMRPAVQQYGQSWLDLMGEGAKAAVTGSYTAAQVLEMVALRAAGDVAKVIQSITAPPLSPRTVAARANKSTKPLVHTGQLIQSITGKVEAAGA